LRKKIGILVLAFLVFYHIPLEVYSISIGNNQEEEKNIPSASCENELFYDISSDVMSDPYIQDSEFRNTNANLNYFDQNNSLKNNLKLHFLLSIPFHLLSQSSFDIIIKSMLSAVKFYIPDSHLISLQGNQFSLRI
jgi:hypothetical protein